MQIHFTRNGFSIKLLFIVMALGLFSSCKKDDHQPPPPATDESANIVYDWYRLIMRLQQYSSTRPSPPASNRYFGYVGVGLYESVQPGIKGAVSLSNILYQMPAMPEPEAHKDYSWGASANAALASLFKQFFVELTDANRASIDSLETANNNRFRSSISEEVLNRSQAFGRAVATAIYNWSTTDNFTLSADGYVLPVFPGSWVPTPPAFAAPVGPFLKDSRPFLQSSLTVPVAPPIPYSEDTSSAFYKAAKEVYDVGVSLTDDQKAIANYWADIVSVGSGLVVPGHFLSIITDVLEDNVASLDRAVEVYAKTGIAHKDAFILTWQEKFRYNLLRPITYINQQIDTSWRSYLANPPYPDYTSGLSGIFTPLMQILIREFGDIPINDDTYAENGFGTRHYDSISEMIDEAAASRFYGGIHYWFTMQATIKQGKDLGNRIADIDLTPGVKY